jgi:hypothetical protein
VKSLTSTVTLLLASAASLRHSLPSVTKASARTAGGTAMPLLPLVVVSVPVVAAVAVHCDSCVEEGRYGGNSTYNVHIKRHI